MRRPNSDRDPNVQRAFVAALHALEQARIALWAYDYEVARSVLLSYQKVYEPQILFGLAIHKAMQERKKFIRANIRRDERRLSKAERRKMQVQIAEEAHKVIAETNTNSQSLILPFCATVISLERMRKKAGLPTTSRDQISTQQSLLVPSEDESEEASIELDLEVKEHPDSGLRYVEIQDDDNHWEWRAYKFEGVETDIRKLVIGLQAIVSGVELIIESSISSNKQAALPYRFRWFLPDGFIEIHVLDQNRLTIQITVAENHLTEIVLPIFSACHIP